MAYEQVTGPIGPERQDLLNGVLAAVIANSARGKRGRRAKASDFIPRWDSVKRTMGADAMFAAVRQINAALSGRDTTKDGGGDDGGPRRTARRDRAGRRGPDERGRRRRA